MNNEEDKRKVVVVTGGGSGKATALALLSSGFNVIEADETFDIPQPEAITISSFGIDLPIDNISAEVQGKRKHKKKGKNRRQW